MTFERITKNTFHGKTSFTNGEIFIGYSGFSFDRKLLDGMEYLELYLDRDGERIGFKKGTPLTGFKICNSRKDKTSNKRISIRKGVMKKIGRGIFVSHIEDEMIIIEGVEFTK